MTKQFEMLVRTLLNSFYMMILIIMGYLFYPIWDKTIVRAISSKLTQVWVGDNPISIYLQSVSIVNHLTIAVAVVVTILLMIKNWQKIPFSYTLSSLVKFGVIGFLQGCAANAVIQLMIVM